MELRLNKHELVSALSLAHRVADRTHSLPILANVLLRADGGKLLLAATDLSVGISIEMSAKVSNNGELTLDAKSLFEIARKLPNDELHISMGENLRAEIKCGRAQYRLVGLPARYFPNLPDHSNVTFTKIPTEILRDMISKTIFSVSRDETRVHLNGVLFESDGDVLRMVSTDGSRLSLVERKHAGPKLEMGVILSQRGVSEIARVLDDEASECEIGVAKQYAFLRIGKTVLSTKLIETRFPDYRLVIPTNFTRVVAVNRVPISEALRRVRIMSPEKTSCVRIRFSDRCIELVSNNPEFGDAREEVDSELQGESFEINMNARFISELLAQMSDETVRISRGGEDFDPCLISSGDGSYSGVIMPMRDK